MCNVVNVAVSFGERKRYYSRGFDYRNGCDGVAEPFAVVGHPIPKPKTCDRRNKWVYLQPTVAEADEFGKAA